jgi:hypothetical protein
VPAADYDRVLDENAALRERIVELEAADPRQAEPAARVPAVPATPPAEMVDLRVRLATAIAERDRFAAGVDRCVEELNRVRHSRRIVVGQGSAAPTPAPPTPQTRTSDAAARQADRDMARAFGGLIETLDREALRPVRTLSAPQVQILGEDVLVSARLWNPEDVDQRVTIEIALLADGVVQKQATQDHLVPAGGDLAVSARFHSYGTYEGKTLSGRVRPLR